MFATKIAWEEMQHDVYKGICFVFMIKMEKRRQISIIWINYSTNMTKLKQLVLQHEGLKGVTEL